MKNLIIKYTITTVLFFVLSLIQSSFLPFFSIVGQIPNLVFILFYVILFFDNRGESFFWAILVGFLLDVFMPSYFGISIISLLVIYLLKKILDYFLKDIQGKYFIVYLIFLFSINFVIYSLLVYAFSLIFRSSYELSLSLMVSLAYNIILFLPAFYIYKFIARPDYLENQLKLL